MSKIGWPVRKAKAIFLTGKQDDFGDARKRSIIGRWMVNTRGNFCND